MTTISKGSCDVKIYWLTQTIKWDVYAVMQKYYFAFYPYIFSRSQYYAHHTIGNMLLMVICTNGTLWSGKSSLGN